MKHKTLFLTIPILILFGLLLVGNPWLVTPAQAGDADDLLVKSFGSSFGPDGSGTALLNISPNNVTGMAVQPDGKYVLVGRKNEDFWVARFNADGSKDTGFGSLGEITTDIGLASNDNATDVAIQPDGKIVVVGQSAQDFAVARYLPNGDPDNSFNGVGRLTTNFDGGLDFAEAVALQPDGKIVVGGTGNDCGSLTCSQDFALARYNPDGSLDSSFDGDGRRLVNFGARYEELHALFIEADGKIIAAGEARDVAVFSDQNGIIISRHHANGSLDTDFARDGTLLSTAFGEVDGAAVGADDAVVQPDGKIVVINANVQKMARFNASGIALDTTFGTTGVVPLDTPEGSVRATNILLQPDNTVLVAGFSTGALNQIILASYTPGGLLDPNFGDGAGYVTLNYGDNNNLKDMVLEASGKPVVLSKNNSSNYLTRLYPDGSLDDGGRVTANVSPGEDEQVYDTAVTSDGRIITVGHHYLLGTDRMTAVRYNANGSLDTSFNGTGIVSQSPGGGPAAQHTYGRAVALDANDNIVIAGRRVRITQSQGDIALWRYQTDGSTDFFTTLDLGGDETANAVAVQPDGKILVAGEIDVELLGKLYFLARFNADGSLDETFIGGGYTFGSFNNQSNSSSVNALVLQPDGKIVLAGWNNDAGNFSFGLARHLPDGSPDFTFGGGDGTVVTDLGAIDVATAVTVLADGKIVAAGYGGSNNTKMMIVLYSADGISVTTNGADFGTLVNTSDMTLAANGDIVVAGCTLGSDHQFALARFKPSGQFDPEFSSDGKAAFSFSKTSECAQGIALDPTTGNLVVAGQAQIFDDQHVALARIADFVEGGTTPPSANQIFLPLIVK